MGIRFDLVYGVPWLSWLQMWSKVSFNLPYINQIVESNGICYFTTDS